MDNPKVNFDPGLQSSDYVLEPDTFVWWSTPILRRSCPGHEQINEQLKALIYQKMKSSEGTKKSNEGGWHSEEDLLHWGGPAIAQFQNWIIETFQDLTEAISDGRRYEGKLKLNAWANVNKSGDYNASHTHPACVWSGVYYVDAGTTREGQRKKAGAIEFMDPRAGSEMMTVPGLAFGKSKTQQARTGDIVVFPSWLRHQVYPYEGNGERISIAFNVRIRPATNK